MQLSVSQRTLIVLRDDLSNIEPDETLLGRLEHRLNLAKGAISSNLFYELGSGLEQRREFIYLEVQPGQGAYVWNDYDGDGIRDLDEFEIAAFAYEANFIRSWVPSNQYSRTFSNQFSETLLLQPARTYLMKTVAPRFKAITQQILVPLVLIGVICTKDSTASVKSKGISKRTLKRDERTVCDVLFKRIEARKLVLIARFTFNTISGIVTPLGQTSLPTLFIAPNSRWL